MVESQAVGRRNQAKGASLSAGVASAPYPPQIPRDTLKTPGLYFRCGVLMHSVLWQFVYFYFLLFFVKKEIIVGEAMDICLVQHSMLRN